MKFKKEEIKIINEILSSKKRAKGKLTIKATNVNGDCTHKVCGECKEFKETAEFYPAGKYWDNLCIPCRKEENRKKHL